MLLETKAKYTIATTATMPSATTTKITFKPKCIQKVRNYH